MIDKLRTEIQMIKDDVQGFAFPRPSVTDIVFVVAAGVVFFNGPITRLLTGWGL